MATATSDFEILGEEKDNSPFEVMGEEPAKSSPADEVKRALSTIPKPKIDVTDTPPYGLYETGEQARNRLPVTPPTPIPTPRLRDLVAGALNMAVDPQMGGGGPAPRTGTQYVQGAEKLNTPGQRAAGAAQVVGATGDLLSPLLGVGALEAPVSTAVGLGTGMATGKGARAVTKAAGGGEGAQDLAENLGYWIPALTGAALRPKLGVAVTPEEVVVRGGVAPRGMEPKVGEVRFSRGGQEASAPSNGLQPPTIEGNAQPPAPPKPPVSPASPSMVQDAVSALARADRMDAGLPPEVPPPPPPAPPPLPEVTPQSVAHIGDTMEKLPQEQRAPAIIQIHQQLAAALLQQGKVVGPDGRLEIIDSDKTASRVAQAWINDEVGRRDDVAAEKQKAAEKESPKTAKAAPVQRPTRATLEQAKGTQLEVVGEEQATNLDQIPTFDGSIGRPEETLPEKEASDRKYYGLDKPLHVGEQVIEGHVLPPEGKTSDYEYRGGKFYKDGNVLDKSDDIADAVAALEPQKMIDGEVVQPDEPTHEVIREEPAPLQKGEKVTLSDGRPATVKHASPTMNLVRLETDGGEKFTVSGAKEIAKLRSRSGVASGPTSQALENTSAAPDIRVRIAKLSGERNTVYIGYDAPQVFIDSELSAHDHTGFAKRLFPGKDVTDTRAVKQNIGSNVRGHHGLHVEFRTSQEAKDALAELDRMQRGGAPAPPGPMKTEIAPGKVGEVKVSEPERTSESAASKPESPVTSHLREQIETARSYGYEVKLINQPPKGYTAKHFPGTKVIEVYTRNRTPEQLATSLNHEIGHIVDYQRRGIVADPMGDSIRSEYTGEMQPMGDAQTYFRMGPKVKEAEAIREAVPRKDGAATTQKEIYADAYRLYKENPKRLEEIAPIISKEISEFVRGESATPGEPTLPGMEQVPAERAEANAEQQGQDLTAKLTEPPKSIERAAGEIEQKSPLFRDTEANPQGNIFGDLFSGESGELDPSKMRDAAGAVGNFLKASVERKTAQNLQSGIYDLDPQYQADVLEAVQAMEKVNKELGKGAPAAFESIYHHLENPNSEKLTPERNHLLDHTVLPIMEDTDAKFSQLEQLLGRDGTRDIDNYVHRVVKGKGGWFDRIVAGSKGSGRGNLLSKSAPQSKGRTMMALELDKPAEQGSLLDKPGDRVVVSIKGGQVTAWRNGTPENLGAIQHTDEGKGFEDKNGNHWTLTQATTKEIEANTELEYYHNALASALVSNLQVGKALRGAEFVEAFKNSPDFKLIAQKEGSGTPPKGWRGTDLPQLRGYNYDPRVADVLDWYSKRLRNEGPSVFDEIGKFLRTSIFFNPLIHIPNIANHWLVERGAGGMLPTTGGREFLTAATRAINAVTHQNQDFLDALRAGAPLQSQRDAVANLQKLFFDQLTESLEKGDTTVLKIAKAVGMSPVDLVKQIYKFSGKATWVTNDILFMQSAYEKVGRGMPLKEALTETARHIPDYRLPVRILNSKGIGNLMSNQTLTLFGGYHYGALKSYVEMAKSALGATEPPTGSTKAEESAHGFGLLAWLGLITFGLYPLLDQIAKKVSGDKNARVRRAGASTFPFNLTQLAKHEKTPTEVLESVATPAVHTKTAVEMAANRDLHTGRHIYDPQADWKTQGQQIGRRLLEAVSPVGQATRMYEQKGATKRFLYGLAGVSFPKQGAEKIASEIAQSHMPGKAESPEARSEYYRHREILEALRNGDSGPLNKAREAGKITHDQAHELRKRARLDPLEDQVNSFSADEFMRVYEAATPEQKQQLDRIRFRKRRTERERGNHAAVEELSAVSQ